MRHTTEEVIPASLGGRQLRPPPARGPEGQRKTEIPTNLLWLHFAGGGCADVFQPPWRLTNDRNSTLMAAMGREKVEKGRRRVEKNHTRVPGGLCSPLSSLQLVHSGGLRLNEDV